MKSEPEKVHNILLVAITRLGDMLQASPTIVGLKREYPHAKITVAIEKQFAAICEGIPDIDEIYEIDLGMLTGCLQREGTGVIDAYRYITKVVDDLRERQFDFCLNMSSSGYTAVLLKMLDVQDSRGWVSDEEGHRLILNPWSMLFSAFVYHSNRDYNAINIVDIFRCSAGVTEHPHSLRYDVPEADRNFGREFLEKHGIAEGGPLIAVQAGASQEKRQWSVARLAHLSRLLVEKLGARLVFTGSTSEQQIIDKVFSLYHHPKMISAAGQTSLSQLGSLLEASDLLVTGDTGTMHLSVAVGTPTVSVFLASALCFETGPYSEGNIVLQPLISCNPCNPNLPCSRTDCHDQIPPELVYEMVMLRLRTDDRELLGTAVPASIADPAQVAVYVTTFDDEGFLIFKQLNPQESRNGYAREYYPAARETYRALWKSEFQQAPFSFPHGGCEGVTGLPEARAKAQQGSKLIERLLELIDNPASPPRMLGELGSQLEQLDRALEDIGLSNAALGALVRMFVMEKENMRGEDPRLLAQATKALYDTFARRCERFGDAYSFYQKKFQGDQKEFRGEQG